jgi:hypothetical protein
MEKRGSQHILPQGTWPETALLWNRKNEHPGPAGPSLVDVSYQATWAWSHLGDVSSYQTTWAWGCYDSCSYGGDIELSGYDPSRGVNVAMGSLRPRWEPVLIPRATML